MKPTRQLSHLQLSRAAMCPACGAAPFELCRNIPGDETTHTRYVHGVRIRRVARKAGPLSKVQLQARKRLMAGRQLRAA